LESITKSTFFSYICFKYHYIKSFNNSGPLSFTIS